MNPQSQHAYVQITPIYTNLPPLNLYTTALSSRPSSHLPLPHPLQPPNPIIPTPHTNHPFPQPPKPSPLNHQRRQPSPPHTTRIQPPTPPLPHQAPFTIMPINNRAPFALRPHPLVFIPQLRPRHPACGVPTRHMRIEIDTAHRHHRGGILRFEVDTRHEARVDDADGAQRGEVSYV